ncbi:Predicted protein [Prochlorococcus marinus subsp. marinus str. CCMP1375]|uniref:Uncharacterized protein n=1 Tax=Prochlorococcus marinus (strain SARG / CCMP1375 / SS120) TaxID=167539 RepID=Q7VCU3_PROMA|nr:Predicted protein [Prochlorococcus marinus subsp. marinus str. CCMP1375]
MLKESGELKGATSLPMEKKYVHLLLYLHMLGHFPLSLKEFAKRERLFLRCLKLKSMLLILSNPED